MLINIASMMLFVTISDLKCFYGIDTVKVLKTELFLISKLSFKINAVQNAC